MRCGFSRSRRRPTTPSSKLLRRGSSTPSSRAAQGPTRTPCKQKFYVTETEVFEENHRFDDTLWTNIAGAPVASTQTDHRAAWPYTGASSLARHRHKQHPDGPRCSLHTTVLLRALVSKTRGPAPSNRPLNLTRVRKKPRIGYMKQKGPIIVGSLHACWRCWRCAGCWMLGAGTGWLRLFHLFSSR